MGLLAWSLVPASLAFVPPAEAQARSINIPAGPMVDSIRRLSEVTGASIGFSGALPSVRTREVRKAPSAAHALQEMLNGTGYRAVATGPSSFRIEQAPATATRPARAQPLPSRIEAVQPEIVVTALKRPQALATLPATARVVREGSLKSATGIAGTDQLSREVPSLTVSSVGPGLNRLFLRGIGDGPLNGFNQGSVAVLLDESRLNYDAPDPDWALVDIDQVEVLEGPQGPLYGTGALGGIVTTSTTRPDLSQASAKLSAGLSLTHDSDLSDSQSVIANLPVIPGRLAVRVVGYHSFQDGWIDNLGGQNDSNKQRLSGGRLAIRWVPAKRWTVDLSGAFQNRRARDSQYVDGDLGPLQRVDRIREPRDLDAKNATLTIAGQIGSLSLTSVTGVSWQEIAAAYDATPLAEELGMTGPTMVADDRHYRVVDQEIRIRETRPGSVSWLAGLSFIDASTDADIVAKDTASQRLLLSLKRSVTEAAVFGEASTKISRSLTLGGGARVFSISIDDEEKEALSTQKRSRSNVRGAVDANLTWTPRPSLTAFLRAATGYRPGGTNVEPDATQLLYEADELASVELGTRIKVVPAVSLDVTFFGARWKHVQADELLQNGLVATRNRGNAQNIGVETDARWSIDPSLTLRGGFMMQSARLESSGQGSGIDDPRLPVVPHFSGRFALDQTFHWGPWKGEASLGVRYIGATHLSFDPVLDRRTASRAIADGSISLSRNGWTAALVGENLTNSTADTFAFGNPYRVRQEPQRTPSKPRTVGLTVSRTF